MNIIFDAIDSDYVKLRHDIHDGTFTSVYANQLKSVMSQLSVDKDLVYLDAARIILPKGAVKKNLPLVHTSHIGMTKTYELCRSLYFWPGMFNDIRQMICQCTPCSVNRSSQPKNPRSTQPPSSQLGPPISHVGLDLFDFGGKQHLICVDHWSGYPMFSALSSNTSSAVINVLRSWFNLLGWPQSIRSDGGPQFRGEFAKFCVDNGILHELSAPYNPRSNGLAELGVKIVKSILIKCLGERKALYKWRNARRQHGFSPAQLMFGRSLFPEPAKAFAPIDLKEAAVAKDKAFG